MKSLCIKTNNLDTIDYLLNELNDMFIENAYFSCKNFKSYTNIIIHYTGNDSEYFLSEISTLLSFLVIDNFEEILLKNLIIKNYFYFDSIEIKKVLNICSEILYDSNEFSLDDRHLTLFNTFYDYLLDNKNLFLSGFIYFRLQEYINFLENIIDIAVNKFIIEREYLEFISLLKLYIKSNSTNSKIIHLLYTPEQITLLDENNNYIDVTSIEFNTKYLSDISFSSNDYVLNALLTILPNKIFVHLGNYSPDEFINTLMLIFEDKIVFPKENKKQSFLSNKK
jgi:putative sporulation protein YtxC